jgi:hypothetical protein
MAPLQTASVEDILREVDEFLMNSGPVQATLQRLAQSLSSKGIDYAIIGGMALALHGFVRPTQDIDLLMTAEGLERFEKEMSGRGYLPAFAGAKKHFRDTQTGVRIEVITSGEYPGDGKPKPVVFPDPSDAAIDMGNYRVVGLERLIELKLASGMTADYRQLRDMADVQQLIETLNLPLGFNQKLNPFVRDEYERLWRLAQKGRERDSEKQSD